MTIRNIHISTLHILGLIIISSLTTGCQDSNLSTPQINNNEYRPVDQKTKDYWYDGTAEVSSYKLTQARYGELREGTISLVFVTEPFSKSSFTKADNQTKKDVPVLKLNMSKKFTTGIYPYSMMNSSFFPFEGESTSLKLASSMQEWCGMTYREMKNEKNKLVFKYDSYFEGQSFDNKKINKNILEDDIWSLIRLNPELLPTGDLELIPSMFFLTLKHKELKAYGAIAKLDKGADDMTYAINYPTLNRTISISYETEFPHAILKWEESYMDSGKMLTTTAERISSIKTDYWSKNRNVHSVMRDELGLK